MHFRDGRPTKEDGRLRGIRSARDVARSLAQVARGIAGRPGAGSGVEAEDGFADAYAQTLVCGLLSARLCPGAGLTTDDVLALLHRCLARRGHRGRIAFRERDAGEVVQLLDRMDWEGVLRDFRGRDPQEHLFPCFYELFLREYDPRRRLRRGVFSTPRPVVSFIVRSVDEILRKEFGLEHGLADTTTWAELAERHPGLRIPGPVPPEAPFVQVLDPATGTGTFLLEVIERTHRTLEAKWRGQGRSAEEIGRLWDQYVPAHLLPRLHGFEVLAAPYAIAHVQIALALRETGCRLPSAGSARLHLANSLEAPHDLVGSGAPITVILGNPPYSQYSANLGERAREHVARFRRANGERLRVRNPLQLERNLNDDYVKFFGWATGRLCPEAGVIGLVTNRAFLDAGSLVGLRECLAREFPRAAYLDLHGDAQAAARTPRLAGDRNVFAISQGVAVSLLWRPPTALPELPRCQAGELIGPAEDKLARLAGSGWTRLAPARVEPGPPHWWLTARTGDDGLGVALPEVMPEYATLVASNRDHLVTDFDPEPVLARVEAFRSFTGSDARLCAAFGITRKSNWNLAAARERLRRLDDLPAHLVPIEYRPFDRRVLFFHKDLVWQTSPVISRNVLNRPPNLVLVSLGRNRAQTANGQWVTRVLADKSVVSSRDNASGFPLYLYDESAPGLAARRRANLGPAFVAALTAALGVGWQEDGPSQEERDVGPEDVLHYLYALLYSPTYRSHNAEALTLGFPRLSLPGGLPLFRELCRLGADLVALHLLEEDYPTASWRRKNEPGPLSRRLAAFGGAGPTEVARGYPRYADGQVWINPTRRFEGVPAEVWAFSVGGHPVCFKWLKDRRGRRLTDREVVHYQRIVDALAETIRLMSEIDAGIAAHGGWPGAFLTTTDRP
jgi:hypothetical protein